MSRSLRADTRSRAKDDMKRAMQVSLVRSLLISICSNLLLIPIAIGSRQSKTMVCVCINGQSNQMNRIAVCSNDERQFYKD